MIFLTFLTSLAFFLVCIKYLNLRTTVKQFIGEDYPFKNDDLTRVFFWRLEQALRLSKLMPEVGSANNLIERISPFNKLNSPAIFIADSKLDKITDFNKEARTLLDDNSILAKLKLLNNINEDYIDCKKLADRELYSNGFSHITKLGLDLKEYSEEDLTVWCLFKNNNLSLMEGMLLTKELSRRIRDKFSELKEFKKYKKNIASSRKSNIEKSQFISGLSHDLRSPINNLQVVNNLLKEENLTKDQKELLDLNQINIRMINSLIEDLLSISSYRAGKLKAKPVTFNPHELINFSLGLFKLEAEQKGLEFKFLCDDKDVKIKFDKLQLLRIVSNLVFNAIKYTTEGNVTLSIKRLNEQLVISVEDTGPGIAKDQLKLLCRPFQRLADEEVAGSGLGLAVTKILLKLNDADLRIDSELGQGSRFSVICS